MCCVHGRWLDFRGLLQLRNIVRLPLDDVFVPLQATTALDYTLPPLSRETPDSDAEDYVARGRYYTERRVALGEVLRQHHRLVVLGDPGSGKSTLLRFLALTFAQGRQQVQERFGINEERLPILVPLSAFAEAQKPDPGLSLAELLPRYFTGQGLPDFSRLFDDALRDGRALVLLDGLDEMLTYDDRAAVARAVFAFASTYSTARLVITSRIAGYTPGMLPADFAMSTLTPFDDDAIKEFSKRWSLALEALGLPSPEPLPPDARRRATLRADNLTASVTSHPGVRRLATNPLLLTLLALIHDQGTRLPHRRVDLYRLCVEALAETWNLARSLTGRPIDLRLGERRLDEEFVVRILAPIAYWMHETKPMGLVRRDELEARVAEQFVEHEGVSSEEAMSLARDFLALVREQMGLLVERAPDEFSFLHLSVQEYLAARFLSERMNAFKLLKPRLHHPRWREVVLLTAGCLRGDYATAFVEHILDAHGPFNDLPNRVSVLMQATQEKTAILETLRSLLDLLLAAHCVGDDVSVRPPLRQQIRNALFALWLYSPFDRLRNEIVWTFAYLKGCVIGPDVPKFLLKILHDRNRDALLRGYAARALGQVGREEAEVAETLLSLVRDRTEDPWVRGYSAWALGDLGQGEPWKVETLLNLVRDRSEDGQVRGNAAWALGRVGLAEAEVVETLLSLVRDRSEDGRVRGDAIWALGRIERGESRDVEMLLHLLRDRDEHTSVRQGAAWALGRMGRGEAQEMEMLLHLLGDESEDSSVRRRVAWALGQVGRWNADVIEALLRVADDPSLRDAALDALWDLLS